MQANAPDVLDLSKESRETLKLYGINEKVTDTFGRQCLMARRLCEAGVRFVQVTYGDNSANRARRAAVISMLPPVIATPRWSSDGQGTNPVSAQT